MLIGGLGATSNRACLGRRGRDPATAVNKVPLSGDSGAVRTLRAHLVLLRATVPGPRTSPARQPRAEILHPKCIIGLRLHGGSSWSAIVVNSCCIELVDNKSFVNLVPSCTIVCCCEQDDIPALVFKTNRRSTQAFPLCLRYR